MTNNYPIIHRDKFTVNETARKGKIECSKVDCNFDFSDILLFCGTPDTAVQNVAKLAKKTGKGKQLRKTHVH